MNLVAADVRRLILKSEIRNPKSEIARASSRRLLRFRASMREIFRGNLSRGERAGVKATQPSNTRSRFPRKIRSEEHTSELQSRVDLVCRLLLEKKKNNYNQSITC